MDVSTRDCVKLVVTRQFLFRWKWNISPNLHMEDLANSPETFAWDLEAPNTVGISSHHKTIAKGIDIQSTRFLDCVKHIVRRFPC